ncbi:MAG: sulfotransferase family 2 domain-containing protein [Pseudomonadota bacterium]
MGVHLYQHGLSYFSVPKCACTSLKAFFFEIENGFEWRPFRANGKRKTLHQFYSSKRFSKEVHPQMQSHWKAAVVRDPVARLLSAYSNRVLYHNELNHIALTDADRESGLTLRPRLSLFIRHLERYRELSKPLWHHTRPMVCFLGEDPGFFDAIYGMREIDAFRDAVKARIGQVPEVRRLQTGGKKIDRDVLKPAQVKKIEGAYAADYAVFSAHL